MFPILLSLFQLSVSLTCHGEDLLANQNCNPSKRLTAAYARAEADNGVTGQYQSPFPGLFNLTALNQTFHELSDLFPKVVKLTHSIGAVAIVEIDWTSSNYTGLFKGKHKLFTRFSAAAGPPIVTGEDVYFLPNISFKQFRRTHSGTLQFATGTVSPNSTSFFTKQEK